MSFYTKFSRFEREEFTAKLTQEYTEYTEHQLIARGAEIRIMRTTDNLLTSVLQLQIDFTNEATVVQELTSLLTTLDRKTTIDAILADLA